MVLSAPAADAAPPAAPWLDRLTRIFHLGQGRGVMVLVRGAPERLGEAVRHVMALSPDADVLLRADQIATLPPGSTAVLRLRPEDFDWLNIGRPVVLGHRIVLFGDPETALALERRSFDFFDWISHRIDAPAGAPSFAVRDLRNSVCQRSPALVWRGEPVDLAFAEALPGRSLSRVSAAQPYPDLVTALRPKPRTWVLVTDLDEAFRIHRARWASAEAGRRGRTILLEPEARIDGLPVVHATPMDIDDAAAKLGEAGIEHGARLAALLDLAPEAIEKAAILAKGGAGEMEIARTLANAGPGGARGGANEGKRLPTLPGWPERVAMAIEHGDEDVALHWATSWRAAEPDSARATATLAYVRMSLGRPEEARALLDEAIRQAGPSPDTETKFEIRRVEGMIREAERDLDGALAAFDEAVRLLREMDRPTDEVDLLQFLRVRTLIGLGRLREAARSIHNWPTRTEPGAGDILPRSLAIALLKQARGEVEGILPFLRRALVRGGDIETQKRDVLAQMLAQALLDRNEFEEAERVTRAAVSIAENRGRATAPLRHEHARALLGLGRFAEAERELREVLTTLPEGGNRSATLHELSRCLSAQGRLEEAEELLDEAIGERDHGAAANLSMLYHKAHLLGLQGDHEKAIALLGEVLHGEEQALGRNHPTLVHTLTALGDSLIQNHKSAAAQPFLRRAIRLAEHAGDDLGLAVALGNLAVAQAMQRFPQAAHTARRALDVWNRTGAKPTDNVLSDMETIAAGGLALPASLPPSRAPSTR